MARRLRQQPASAKSLATMERRAKVRTQFYGTWVWIRPQHLKAFTEAMNTIRESKRKWSSEVWSKRVRKEIKEKWGGLSHGGVHDGIHGRQPMAARGQSQLVAARLILIARR